MECASCHITEGTVSASAVANCKAFFKEELAAETHPDNPMAKESIRRVKAGKLWNVGVSSTGEVMPQHKQGDHGSTQRCWMCWRQAIRYHIRTHPGCTGITGQCMCFA